jgi:DMSO/TMAO reductase YedYZ molybdopterin-dependent catalytic subunit
MGAARTASQSPDPKFKQGLENLKKMPEGRERSMGFAELMLTGATGSGIMGRKGKATMKEEEEEQPTKDTSKDDFSMENVRKRLLERAKQERIARQNQFTREKEVYDQSLPDSVKKKMQKNPLQFMVRGG